jgi:uncharacterized lipoprotein YmbA
MKKYILKKFCFLAASTFAILYMSGCMSLFKQQPYVAVKYYDLDSPTPIELKNIQVEFLQFNSTEPVKYKMVYHNSNYEVVVDDYNKWIQPPSLLLTRYLQSSFQQHCISDPKVARLIISGNIFMYKIDLKNKKVFLGVSYVIKSTSENILRTLARNSSIFSCEIKQQNPQEFVSAMSKCAAQLTTAIDESIKNIHRYNLLETPKSDNSSADEIKQKK